MTYGGSGDAFVTKYGPAGAVVYSSYFGGSGQRVRLRYRRGWCRQRLSDGQTRLSTLPTTPGAYQTAFGGGHDAFVTKFNPTGSGLVYSTYLGGNDLDVGYGIAVDGSGNAYVTGYTQSTNFPTTSGAYQVCFRGRIP